MRRWLVLLPLLLACSTRLPSRVVADYNACRIDKVSPYLAKKVRAGGKDAVLYRYAWLSAQMRQGERGPAIDNASLTQKLIWSELGKGRGVASLASAESIKAFKGEPFERALNAVYLGVLLTMDQDYDNALAAFSRARLALKQSSDKDVYSPLIERLWAQLAKAQGDAEGAGIALKRTQPSSAHPSLLDPKRLDDNVLVLVESGRCPLKTRTGPGDSLTAWVPRDDGLAPPPVEVGGQPISLLPIEETYRLAMLKESTGKDALQATKGVTRELGAVTTVIAANEASRGNKTAGYVALGAGLFTLLNQSQADIRQWEFLPARYFLGSVKLQPGTYTLSVGQRDYPLAVSAQGKPVIFWFPADMCVEEALWALTAAQDQEKQP